ncbi:MAG: type I DNA topoisomerase [Epulopiscium sp.]|nr:type I DNA topoisomerase [Candidatus Epulonipiscium sp.]
MTKQEVSSTKTIKSTKKHLVIVESPAKAKTIKKFLGNSYKIEASMGHIRDLPKSQLGIDLENDFEPRYITIRGKGELLTKLRKEAKTADKVYLATDPDREGEAISWHLLHALNLKDKAIERITFNEITKPAVKKSISEARDIDMDLVDAQQARRVLDRVVGYTLSRLLWQKVKKGLSGGRVQSVALRIICDREEEIRSFIPEEYWSITAKLKDRDQKSVEAKFYGTKDGKVELKKQEEVDAILANLTDKFIITEVKNSRRTKNPVAPFTTSTLQQESSKYLNMAAQKTMMIAQQLYEGVDIKGEGTVGLVSYIRTDSVRISDKAYEEAKQYILEEYGQDYVNPERIVYKSKGKTQDAHEAIRPTVVTRTPESIKESLTKDQFKLYKLIWERFVASQMSPAIYDTMSVKMENGGYQFRTGGSVLKFKGFLEVYGKGEEESIVKLPQLEKDDIMTVQEVLPEQHFTQPPGRFTDASLIKTLEEIGVGRPSTYAPTLTTIQARNYVTKEAKNLYPTELGEMVNDIMKGYFSNIVDTNFTAQMEERLDEVEEGREEWKQIIREFYPEFQKAVEYAEKHLEKLTIKDEVTDILCEKCGRNMVIKYGRYGKFLACPGFPECQNAKPFFEDAGVKCPECEGKVLIKKTKKGRIYFGCENNPECNFMSWNKPTGEKCPECGSYLEEKGKKEPKIVCSNEKCGYIAPKPKDDKDKA